jgi:diguanylate cyclase (GGDEF)-like protein
MPLKTKVLLILVIIFPVFAGLNYGIHHYIILLPTTDMEGSVATAERFRRVIETTPVNSDKGQIVFTVSLGVSHWTKDIKEIVTLMNHADQALYIAKQNGRNRVESYMRTAPSS